MINGVFDNTMFDIGVRDMILNAEGFRHHVDFFNGLDSEPIQNAVSNSQCWEWMCENIPWFECPDADIEQERMLLR